MTDMQRHHHFIFHLTVAVMASLLVTAVTLLYYYGMESYFLARAAEEVTPREYLRYLADERDLDYALLNRIVECESRWKMVKNRKSSAYGYFQILDRTEAATPQYAQGKSKTDPYANIEMGIYLYERYGWFPWTESKPCWGRW